MPLMKRSLVFLHAIKRTSYSAVQLRCYATGKRWASWKWFGIPTSVGIATIALVKLQRTLRESKTNEKVEEASTWQLVSFRQLPTRVLSRTWGSLMRLELPVWLRRPVLGLYVWAFGCNMEEAEQPHLSAYANVSELFTRKLRAGSRPISKQCLLVSPVDGTVLHFGQVTNGTLEQVKGITFQLDKFLGGDSATADDTSRDHTPHYITLYLSPGDYHHFHSPADWNVQVRKHIYGELLPVAPWAARTMPGLFVVNERVLLLGKWDHGFFSLVAVGAHNVGSISLTHDKDLITNKKGSHKMGEVALKTLGVPSVGVSFTKGDHVGNFNMGSTVVLVFQAPKNFSFLVKPGQTLKYGQPLGHIPHTDKRSI